MLSAFLIELKLNEEQEKITQIVTGSSGAQMKPSLYDEYVNASKGKVQQKGKGKGRRERWKAELANALQQLRHFTSQRARLVKPKAKNAEHDEDSNWQSEAEWYERNMGE